jgi:serine protease Do
VCVRLVKANGLDLTLFQFDYDLTFAVFFMNADKTIYGRYGSRSSVQEVTRDISVSGLAAAMSAALEIHKGYPANRESLAGKQPVETEYRTPDDFPSLEGKFSTSLDYTGEVTKSCVHCHQVRDAERQVYRDAGEPIPDRLLFPNPLPSAVGLAFDPSRRATVAEVTPETPADLAGLRPGDEIVTLNGQPIVSLADTQWVLHTAGASDTVEATVLRDEEQLRLKLILSAGWRRESDISWRVSSWPLRRMGTGGLLFEAATELQRRTADVDDDALALVVKHVGQYGAHGAAKRVGFMKGDLVISYDGQDESMTRSQLLAYAAQSTKPGEEVPVVVVRDGRRVTLRLPMQN